MWAATAAIAGSAVVGAYSSKKAADSQADASKEASDAQVQAARENNEFQKWLYEDQKAQNQPWVDVGLKALGQLQRYAGVEGGGKVAPPKLVRLDEQVGVDATQKAEDRQNEIRTMSDQDYVKYVYKEGLGSNDEYLNSISGSEGIKYWTNVLNNQFGGDRDALAIQMGSSNQENGNGPLVNNLYTPEDSLVEAIQKNDMNTLQKRQNALLYEGAR